jgi:plastocyanin
LTPLSINHIKKETGIFIKIGGIVSNRLFFTGFMPIILSLIIGVIFSACQVEPAPDEPIPPTGDEARINASDQNIEFAAVLIDEVVIPVDGWIAIHTDENGEPGEVVGVEALEAGRYTVVEVGIDTATATELLHAMLHIDNGEPGEFEYPGPDEPITIEGEPVMDSFRVGLLLPEQPIEPEDPEEPVVVRILDNAYEPENLTIVPGTIVVWVNEGSTAHTVTSDFMFFDSGILQPGMAFEFTFRDSGEFTYHCQIHGEEMSGRVTVAQP